MPPCWVRVDRHERKAVHARPLEFLNQACRSPGSGLRFVPDIDGENLGLGIQLTEAIAKGIDPDLLFARPEGNPIRSEEAWSLGDEWVTAPRRTNDRDRLF